MRRRGTSLIEVLIASTVFAAMATVALNILTFALHTSSNGMQVAGLQGQVEAACHRLVTDLEGSSSSWVTLQPALVFPIAFDLSGAPHVNGDGSSAWQAWIVYYVDSGQNLRRVVVTQTPTAPGFNPSPYMHGQGNAIAANVTGFQVTQAIGSNGVSMASISLTAGASNTLLTMTRTAILAGN